MRRRMGRGFGLAIVTFVAACEMPSGRLRAQAPAATPPPKVVLQEPIIVAAPEPAPAPSPYAGSLLEGVHLLLGWVFVARGAFFWALRRPSGMSGQPVHRCDCMQPSETQGKKPTQVTAAHPWRVRKFEVAPRAPGLPACCR